MQAYKCLYRCCPVVSTEPDDIAIHLLERHGWDYERARLWLRDTVEEDSVYAKP